MRSKIENRELLCPSCFHKWIEMVDTGYIIKTICKKCGKDIIYSIEEA